MMIQTFVTVGNLMLSRRELLYRTTVSEIRRRYAGSIIGSAWLLIGPVLLMALYATIYGVVFRMKPPDMSSNAYIIYILVGLVPFLSFSEAVTNGTTSLSTQRDVLLNTVFPAELVPLRAVLVSFTSASVGLVVIMVSALFLGNSSPWILLVPFIMLFLLLFVVGLVWILSLANLVFPDIQQLLSYVMMVLLITSPIAYTPSMLPPGFSIIIWLNPLSYFVLSLQSVVVSGAFPPVAAIVGCVVLGLGSFAFGWRTFMRGKAVFFDYA
jgi:lipopolysaccharide transport system permease protein